MYKNYPIIYFGLCRPYNIFAFWKIKFPWIFPDLPGKIFLKMYVFFTYSSKARIIKYILSQKYYLILPKEPV